MSGWIKIEKSIESDPRVLRMAKALDRRATLFLDDAELDPCNATALPGVTLLVGALTRLWIYADSHIRDDNTLDLSTGEIDEWLGIPGFCDVMPDDWLRAVDETTVELPGFQEHNGVEARKKALTQKRVAQHRSNTKRNSVTDRNATALPDQTRPDQDKTKKEEGFALAREVSGLDREAWDRWLAYRRGIKKPIREVSAVEAARDMAKLGAGQAAAVAHTMAKGWTGLREPDPAKPSAPPKREREPTADEIAAARARAAAENATGIAKALKLPSLRA